MMVATLAYVAFNFWLWWSPISQGLLLVVSVLLGIAAFCAFLWLRRARMNIKLMHYYARCG